MVAGQTAPRVLHPQGFDTSLQAQSLFDLFRRHGQPVETLADGMGDGIADGRDHRNHHHFPNSFGRRGFGFRRKVIGGLIPDRDIRGPRQRVPVEVSLDPKELMEHPLRIGLSMTATIDTKNEDIAEMPDLASTVTSMPAYTSKALVIDTSPIEKEISNIISHNGQL